MERVETNERVLLSDITKADCLKIEKILRENNISYFEKWKFHTGIFKAFDSSKHSKCDIYVHLESLGKARDLLGIKKTESRKKSKSRTE